MKNKLLITTALVALVSASNAYADALNITDGDTHKITTNETVDSLEMTGGSLTGAADVDGSMTVTGNANISGGTINLTGHYDSENEDNEKYSDLTSLAKITISGENTIVNITEADIHGSTGFEISGGKIIMGKDAGLQGITEVSGGEINATDTNDISGGNLVVSGGKINLTKDSELTAGGDLTVSDTATINVGTDSRIMSMVSSTDGVVTNEANNSINISGGTINLNDNARMIRGSINYDTTNDTNALVTENINANVKGGIKMTGGVVNMNGTSSIEVYTTDGKLSLDGSSITGSSAEELLAKAPTINVNGNNKIVSDIDMKDGLIKVNKGATLTSGDINLASGNFVSIIDLAGTLDANVTGSDKAQMTFFDSNAKIKGSVDGIKDVNVRSNLSLASAFEKGATNIDNINVYGSTLTLDNENFNEAKNLILNEKSTAKLAGDFTASNKVKVKDGSILDLGTSTLNAKNVELFEDAQVNLKVAALDNHGAIAASDKIIFVGGNAEDGYVNAANKNINLNVTMENGSVKKGETTDLTLMTATNGFDGDFNNVKVSNNRYEFEQIEAGKFKVTGTATGEDIAKDAGGSMNNAAAAAAWVDGDTFNVGTQAAAVASSLNELSQKVGSEQAYVDALTAVAPEVAPLVHKTQTETTNQIFNAVSSRLSGGSIASAANGMSSGDSVFKRGAMWVQGLFNKSKLDDTSKAKGFDADSTGIAMGAEKYINDDVKAGIGYAYTNTDIDGFMRDTDVDTHTAMVYGEYKPSNWYVNGIATYGWSDYSEKKNVAGNQVKADYDVDTIGLQAMTGYDMQVKGFNLTPEAGLRYVHISQDNYKDSADQKVSANDADILTGVIGAKASKDFALENGMNLRPEARLAMTYDLMNDDNNSVVTLANGSAYSVNGEALDRFGIEFGAGLTADVNDNVELSVGYEGKFREDYQDHTGLFNAKYKF
ncbi:MAG: autotransporter domain-containing protein [Alphaproteobacteria bacterium]|jgi:outer membrane autotransporter protein